LSTRALPPPLVLTFARCCLPRVAQLHHQLGNLAVRLSPYLCGTENFVNIDLDQFFQRFCYDQSLVSSLSLFGRDTAGRNLCTRLHRYLPRLLDARPCATRIVTPSACSFPNAAAWRSGCCCSGGFRMEGTRCAPQVGWLVVAARTLVVGGQR
jgi:hypothetical protein